MNSKTLVFQKNFVTIRLLLVEDNDDDALLLCEYLGMSDSTKYDVTRTKLLHEATNCLTHHSYDVILLDLSLPDSFGFDTYLTISKQVQEVPIILLTGCNDQDLAVKAIQSGAQDYLIKGEIDHNLLMRSIRYALERGRLVREQKRLNHELREALENVNVLSGLLPICACCKKIRDDKGYWSEVETYMKKHSDVSFTHGYCPGCYQDAMKDMDQTIKKISMLENG